MHDLVWTYHVLITGYFLDSSVIPNPNVAAQSPSSLLLQWSPPFLWPGYHIDYFKVSTIDRTDCSIISNDIINTTFNEMTVALMKTIDERQPQECNEFLFVISSYNEFHGVHPQTFTVIAHYPSGRNLHIILIAATITFFINLQLLKTFLIQHSTSTLCFLLMLHHK